ncbi:MAG: carboxypeptidase-like regulatory domain-containing protein [Patescibacteria group bacterium]|jgi:hypothetical protein
MEEHKIIKRKRNRFAQIMAAGSAIMLLAFSVSLWQLSAIVRGQSLGSSAFLGYFIILFSLLIFFIITAVAVRFGFIFSTFRKDAHSGVAGKKGIGLIETLITVGILATVGVSLVSILISSFSLLGRAKVRIIAGGVANQQIEILRNLPYGQLGTTTGWPSGSIPASQTITEGQQSFTVATRIDYIDDPFDGNAQGTIQGKPKDTAPSDYKRGEVTVSWGAGESFTLSSRFSPKGVEAEDGTGSLFVHVFGASGQPIANADVHITNSVVVPAINIINITDVNGELQVIGLPPAQNQYHVTVGKVGYSSDQTYASSAQLPNPSKPDVSVIAGDVTDVSFGIDLVSTLAVNTIGENCTPEPLVDFDLIGEKLIGQNPDTIKYAQSHQTDANGLTQIGGLEWDNYTLLLQEPTKDVGGIIPPGALHMLPGTQASTTLVLHPNSDNSLLVTVQDASTGLTVNDAQVQLTKVGYDQTKTSGRGFFAQTDWSGGAGQPIFSEIHKYDSQDGHIDDSGTGGQIRLVSSVTSPTVSEDFSTVDRKDVPNTTADWDGGGNVELVQSAGEFVSPGTVQSLTLNPTSGSITAATLSAVDSTNGQTIQYYLSNDGGLTYDEVTPNVEHVFSLVGNDLRFRLVLSTSSPLVSPIVDAVSVNYEFTAYQSTGSLISSSYDTGSQSEFSLLTWAPSSQQLETGSESVRLQIATNDDGTTWDFVGPDGTSATYFTVSGAQLPQALSGHRYVKYKVYLSTVDTFYTPTLSDIALVYTSGCTPPGQVFFPDLESATYTLDITRDGYTPSNSSVQINGDGTTTMLLFPV